MRNFIVFIYYIYNIYIFFEKTNRDKPMIKSDFLETLDRRIKYIRYEKF